MNAGANLHLLGQLNIFLARAGACVRGLGVQANASPSKLAALAGQASRRCDSNRGITYG